MKLKIIIKIFICLMVLLLRTVIAEDIEIAIICNNNLKDSLSKEEIKQIFLGQKTKWEDNSKIIFVILKNGDVTEKFLKNYVGKTLFQYKNYWKVQIFNGIGKMPIFLESPKDLIFYVLNNKNAIGFVSTKEINQFTEIQDSVRIIEKSN